MYQLIDWTEIALNLPYSNEASFRGFLEPVYLLPDVIQKND